MKTILVLAVSPMSIFSALKAQQTIHPGKETNQPCSMFKNLNGKDPELNSSMVTTADPDNYGGEKINLFGGLNLSFNQASFLKNFRCGAEVGVPVYENYNGIQMNENMSFVIGLKYAYM